MAEKTIPERLDDAVNNQKPKDIRACCLKWEEMGGATLAEKLISYARSTGFGITDGEAEVIRRWPPDQVMLMRSAILLMRDSNLTLRPKFRAELGDERRVSVAVSQHALLVTITAIEDDLRTAYPELATRLP